MKIKDPELYRLMKNFLTSYLPDTKQKSAHTILAYRDALNLYMDFLDSVKSIKLKNVCISDFNQENISSFLRWLHEERGNESTNIYGSLLTSAADFNVRIDPIFDQPDINVEEIKPVEPEIDGNTYSITSAEELAWIAKTVNEGNNLNGKTISIDADIDFGYMPWTPIGTAKTALSADIEGNGHTISNMYIEHDECVGFVGYTWRKVKDLTFLNPIVKGHHWVGVVVGLTQDGCPQFGIENITVENATVTVTPWLKDGSYDDGDKAGVIMGYFPAAGGDAAIRNCTVRNSTVTAFRDLGSIVGYGTYTVTGNTAENVQLIQDMTNGYYPPILVQKRWGEINGYKSSMTTDNTAINVTHTITGN